MDKFLNTLGETKVGDLGKWASANLNKARIGAVAEQFTKQYGATYFGRRGSIKPLVHIMLGVGVLGYALEYSHLAAHERQRKHH